MSRIGPPTKDELEAFAKHDPDAASKLESIRAVSTLGSRSGGIGAVLGSIASYRAVPIPQMIVAGALFGGLGGFAVVDNVRMRMRTIKATRFP